MYCPNCGKTVNAKLKYCNHCGDRLSKAAELDKDGTPGKMLDNILTTLFLVVMFGLGILVGLIAVMLGSDVEQVYVVIITLAYLCAVFGICVTLLSQIPKLIDAKLKASQGEAIDDSNSRLETPSSPQLGEYREPVMSVTDRTTKTLDKVPR